MYALTGAGYEDILTTSSLELLKRNILNTCVLALAVFP